MTVQSVMGFDYGRKRIGVAIGQTLTATASPVCIIYVKNQQLNWAQIDSLIREWQPDSLVVGMPRHADGSDSDSTIAVQYFCEQLRKRYVLPIFTVDETLSSIAAIERMSIKSTRKNENVDAIAAQIILETWFAEQIDVHKNSIKSNR